MPANQLHHARTADSSGNASTQQRQGSTQQRRQQSEHHYDDVAQLTKLVLKQQNQLSDLQQARLAPLVNFKGRSAADKD